LVRTCRRFVPVVGACRKTNRRPAPIVLWLHRECSVPALLNVGHIFLAHLRSSIVVLVRGLRKAKETVKLSANITSFTYSPGERKDALRQFMYDFQFSVFPQFFRLVAPYFIITIRTYRLLRDRGLPNVCPGLVVRSNVKSS
jgi:hypothetical protein